MTSLLVIHPLEGNHWSVSLPTCSWDQVSWIQWTLIWGVGAICTCGSLWWEAGWSVTGHKTCGDLGGGLLVRGKEVSRDRYPENHHSRCCLALSQWLNGNPFLSLFLLLSLPLAWPAVPRHHLFAIIQLCFGLRSLQKLTRKPKYHQWSCLSGKIMKFPIMGQKDNFESHSLQKLETASSSNSAESGGIQYPSVWH